MPSCAAASAAISPAGPPPTMATIFSAILVTRHPLPGHGEGDGFRHFDAIHGGRENAARVARAFSGRVESARVHALVVLAALDADGRRGACFDAGHDRVVHGVAADLLLENR